MFDKFLVILLLVVSVASCLCIADMRVRTARAWLSGARAWRDGNVLLALDFWNVSDFSLRFAKRPARFYYWRAMALDKTGRDREACAARRKMAQMFPADFYSFLAYQNGGIAKSSAIATNYPRPYLPFVREASQATGVSETLIWAIMKRESKFRPSVVSSKGAVGLMQLMPATAYDTARRYGLEASDLKNPRQNIMIGTAHFAELNKKFKGDIVRSVAAYNAGSASVTSWGGGTALSLAEWVENIPYCETREFVRSVLENREMYRLAYEDKKSLPLCTLAKDFGALGTFPIFAKKLTNKSRWTR